MRVLLSTADREALQNPRHYPKADHILAKVQNTALALQERQQMVVEGGEVT